MCMLTNTIIVLLALTIMHSFMCLVTRKTTDATLRIDVTFNPGRNGKQP